MLSGLLDGPRAQRAFVLRCVLDPPFCLRVEDEAPLTVVAVTAGTVAVVHPDATTALGPGDVMIIRGPRPYLVADDPATPPQTVIGPGGACQTLHGKSLAREWELGVRTWGHDLDAGTVLLVGTYDVDTAVGRRLLEALPETVVVPAGQGRSPLVALLESEIVRDDPGQEAVLDRLLDLLLVSALRTWFARPDAEPPAWYAAHADPVVGPALRIIHNNPALPWTVGSLAREVGVSRAALARRFHEQVGEPPMTFLAHWRCTLAADLLREPGATIAVVASEVGYSSPFALSAAFKRVRGVSPAQHRAAST